MTLEAGCNTVVSVRVSCDSSQRTAKTGLEFPALVGCDLLGTAETSNPGVDKGLNDGFGGCLRERQCLREPDVSIDGSEPATDTRRDSLPQPGLYAHETNVSAGG
jgi:hypothetical protein